MRVDLAGKGTPIPTVALPDAGLGDSPPQSFLLVDGVPFEKDQWIAAGYNTFEVWVIGGAGGRGADDGGTAVEWYYTGDANFKNQIDITRPLGPTNNWTPVYEIATPDIWELSLEAADETAREAGVTYYIYNGQQVTPRQLAEIQNPSHLFVVEYMVDPFLTDAPATGGGGGGGGLHYVSGLLDDLPDSIPVSVGKAGIDAPAGQVVVNGNLNSVPSPGMRGQLPDWSHRYPPNPPVYPPPQPGGDGGASSFGDIAMASGGAGGQPRTIWQNDVKVVSAVGGAGGTGGQTEVGGGAEAGLDGSWDGSIGKGGGGGHGGTYDGPHYPALPNPTIVEATPGGNGSFSYSDTTVYGVRQDRQRWIKNLPNGTLIDDGLIIPGGGGGARVKGQGFGSKTTGYSPDGVVYIRLTKIDD